MPFIPHTSADVDHMLKAIGVSAIDELFDEIPASLKHADFIDVPEALNELQATQLMHARQDAQRINFIGAGAYEHHIPAAVWEITTRGEFYSAYTPYQAEASQGTLQLLYEFQTMISGLTGMEVANASLYDGATALAEAVLMAVRQHRKATRILMPANVHPLYRRVVKNLVGQQNIELIDVPYCTQSGHIITDSLNARSEGVAALVISQPNFFGVLEEIDELTDWAHEQGILVIAVVNPLSLAVLRPPGQWGKCGADIVVGEGQPLGVPLSSGGPYFGFMCTRKKFVRQMPGRIVGRTVDRTGRPGFTLTLQAREQHIRRAKATSNICTNQGLMVTAATLYMAIMGPAGMRWAVNQSLQNHARVLEKLLAIKGVRRIFDRPHVYETVLQLPVPTQRVLDVLLEEGIVAGYSLQEHFPDLGDALLICTTEVRTNAEIDRYVQCFARAIN